MTKRKRSNQREQGDKVFLVYYVNNCNLLVSRCSGDLVLKEIKQRFSLFSPSTPAELINFVNKAPVGGDTSHGLQYGFAVVRVI